MLLGLSCNVDVVLPMFSETAHFQYDLARRAVSLQCSSKAFLYCGCSTSCKSSWNVRWISCHSVEGALIDRRAVVKAEAAVPASVLIYGKAFGCFLIGLMNDRSSLSYPGITTTYVCNNGWFSGYLRRAGDSCWFRGSAADDRAVVWRSQYGGRVERVASGCVHAAGEQRKAWKFAAQLVRSTSADDRRRRHIFPRRLLPGPDDRPNTRLPLSQGAQAHTQERQVGVLFVNG